MRNIGRGEKLPEEGVEPGEGEELSPEEVAYLQGFQRVFVEDLGQELLMDRAGNLYDMEGNLIGQADSDKGEDNDDDQKYFEEEDSTPGAPKGPPLKGPPLKEPPSKKAETKPQGKKLPPVAPLGKQQRSHSP